MLCCKLKSVTLPEKTTKAQEFFVVGGPVQADRACYIRRAADDELIEAIVAEEFACVLAPRASGKSSLMGRAIRRLRADGQLAAVVDMAQVAPRGDDDESVRWHYSIAYRICRELRIRLDLQTWWQGKNLLPGEQRLVEFFQDVVLASTSEPVAIFFDEAERAVDLPFAHELFAAVYSCYMRRVSEPESSRLNFVVLGAASPEQLCPDPDVSPFTSGRKIALEDFSPGECVGLAPGLGQQEHVASQAIARAHVWTRGQPYLTQKICRGIARKGAGADVDAIAHELFLAPNVARDEPLLAHMRALIDDDSPRARQAAAIVTRLAKGGEVIDDPRSPAQALLRNGGIVSSDANGMLHFRNRIVDHVFSRDFAARRDLRRQLRTVAIAAAAVIAMVFLPYWYLRVLPQAEIETLAAAESLQGISDAHASLARLPGFGRKADRLLGDALTRLGQGAESISQLTQINERLQALPDYADRPDELLARFWLRRARAMANRGERDSALIHALEAVRMGNDQAISLAANLIDGDYRKLDRSIYLDTPPIAVVADWQRDQVLVVDAARRARRFSLTEVPAAAGPGLQLTALQHVGVTRGISVDRPGLADGLELRLTVEHDRPGDLLIRLRSPSGAAVEIELPFRAGGRQQYVFRASQQNGLAQFGGESIIGPWELSLFDRLSEQTGRLLSWELRFQGVGQAFDDVPVDGLELPDPVRTEQVDVVLTKDGRFAVAMPVLAEARGAGSVWDLSLGARLADLPLVEGVESVHWLTNGRLLVAGRQRATLWDPRSAVALRELVSAGSFAARPAVSPDGEFFALAEVDATSARIGLYRSADGSAVSSFDAGLWQDWMIGAQAAFVAGIDGSRRGRVLNPVTGELLAEFFHERALVNLIPASVPDRILAVDEAGDLFAWTLSSESIALRPEDSRFLGATQSSSSIGAAANTLALSYLDREGFIAVSRMTDGRTFATLQHDEANALWTSLSPDADRLLTTGNDLIRVWSLGSVIEQSADFGDISAVAFDPVGEGAVLGMRSGAVRFINGLPATITAGSASEALTAHRAVVTSLVFSQNGTLAASGDSSGAIRLWDVATGTAAASVLRHPAGPVTAMMFSPDQRWLLTAGLNRARVFDVADGSIVTEFELEGTPQAVAFSTDATSIAIGDSSGNIVLASAEGSAPPRTLRRNAGITALAFVHSPPLLASGTADGELVFWDTSSVSMVGEAQRFAGSIRWLGPTTGAGDIFVHSGGWLHRAERSGDSAAIIASRLLPEPLRSEPALVLRGDSGVRALTHVGGGRLALSDISLVPDDGTSVVEALLAQGPQTIPARNWQSVLGLALDPESGEIRPEIP